MIINDFSTAGKLPNNLDEILIFSNEDTYLVIVIDPFNDEYYDDIVHNDFISHIELMATIDISFENIVRVVNLYRGGVRYSLALVHITKDIMQTAYIGDCRIYFNNQLITTDYSKAWQTIYPTHNNIIGGLCINHIYQRYIYKYLPKSNCTVLGKIQLQINDKIHITTDGFWSIHHYDIISSKVIKIKEEEYIDNSSYVIITI